MNSQIIKTCKTCGQPFSICEGELKWLEMKGFKPFERCALCRKLRRAQRKGLARRARI